MQLFLSARELRLHGARKCNTGCTALRRRKTPDVLENDEYVVNRQARGHPAFRYMSSIIGILSKERLLHNWPVRNTGIRK